MTSTSRATLPSMPADLADRADFDDADRGLIGSLGPCVVHRRRRSGRLGQRRLRASSTATARTPPTRACGARASCRAKQGLYEVTDGIYQVRGLDLSNMTLVEGDDGRHRDRPADLEARRPPPRWRSTASTAATGRSPR